MNVVFAVIVILAILLATMFGIYTVYTWREVEMAKLEQAHEIMNRVRERDK